jgi:peptide/nickel transport system ATP-binding protein
VRRPAALLGLVCGAIVLLVILIGSLRGVAPNAVAPTHAFASPSWAHPFGTDSFGRDELARVAAGGRTSLSAAVLIVLVSMAVALLVGITSGMVRGPVDAVLMRVNDVVLAIPTPVFAMGIVAAFGAGLRNLTIALSISYSAEFTRMARAFTLSSRSRADITAARLAGSSWIRVVTGHVAPEVASQLVVVSTLSYGGVIVNLAGLSFLGLGAQVPTAEWGSMLAGSSVTFTSAPWLILAPGLAIVLTTLSLNLVADSLRERHPPGVRRRSPWRPARTASVPLSVEGLSVTYGNGVLALSDVTMEARAGEVTAVVGESGSGKTTLALALLGLLPADASVVGSALVGGHSVVGASESALRQLRGPVVGYVGQEPWGSFDPLRSVGSTVAEAWSAHRLPAPDRLTEALAGVGLEDAPVRRRPREWSGGMLQRASVVAAGALGPAVIVADEPTSAVDADRADAVLGALVASDAAVILISHDLRTVRAHSDMVVVLRDGRVVERGRTDAVFDHPRDPYTQSLVRAVAPAVLAPPGVDGVPVVAVTGITVRYGRRPVVLDGFDLSVAPGEIVGIKGPSGCGKSTLLRVLASLQRPSAGRVAYDGAPIDGEVRTGFVMTIDQDTAGALDPRWPAWRSATEPLRGVSRASRRAIAAARLVGIDPDARPAGLSGGQRQRVVVQRALIAESRLLVADEPTASLDGPASAAVMGLLAAAAERGAGVVIASHDQATLRAWCHRVVDLGAGGGDGFGGGESGGADLSSAATDPGGGRSPSDGRTDPRPDPGATRAHPPPD